MEMPGFQARRFRPQLKVSSEGWFSLALVLMGLTACQTSERTGFRSGKTPATILNHKYGSMVKELFVIINPGPGCNGECGTLLAADK